MMSRVLEMKQIYKIADTLDGAKMTAVMMRTLVLFAMIQVSIIVGRISILVSSNYCIMRLSFLLYT